MLYVEELLCVSYMLISSLSFLHQLRSQSFVTVECRDVWMFCLEDSEHKSSLRYILNENDMENRCNNQGTSFLFGALVFLLASFELVVFVSVIYGHHFKIKRRDMIVITEKLVLRLIYTLVTITGILTSLLVLLPLVQYYTLFETGNSSSEGAFNIFLHSPPRAFVSFIISLITSPLKSIFHGQFIYDLHLDNVYPNFTCVEPSMDRIANVLKCPMEETWPAHFPEPSACRGTLYCSSDCQIVFPRIIMSSLSVILASFALCYRLLRLHHNIAHTERTFVREIDEGVSHITVANQHTSVRKDTRVSTKRLNVLNHREMKDKAVGSSKPAVRDFKGQTVYEPRYSTFDGYLNGINGAKVEELTRTGQDEMSDRKLQQERKEVKCWKNKNGETRQSENGLVKRRRRRTYNNSESLEELGRHSGDDLVEGALVEDESEYYMSGFRL